MKYFVSTAIVLMLWSGVAWTAYLAHTAPDKAGGGAPGIGMLCGFLFIFTAICTVGILHMWEEKD